MSELKFIDKDSCNICNNGLAKEFMKLVQEDGLSVRKAAHHLEAQMVEAFGGVSPFSAQALRQRFMKTTGIGSKRTTTEKMTIDQADVFHRYVEGLSDSQKNVLSAVLTTPGVTLKEFRATYSGNDNLLSKTKKAVAEVFGKKDIQQLSDDHPIFQADLIALGLQKPKYKPGKEPQAPTKEKKKKPEPKTINNMDLAEAQKVVGLIGATHISKATLAMIETGYQAKWEGKEKKLEKLTQAIGILQHLTKK